MNKARIIGRHIYELTTPCLLLDIDAVDYNIDKMASFLILLNHLEWFEDVLEWFCIDVF